MNSGAQDPSGSAGAAQSVGTNAARGIGVILGAIAVGAILMWLGYSDGTVDAAGDDGIEITTGDSADGAADSTDGSDGSDSGEGADDTGATATTGADDSATTNETTTTSETTTTTAPPASTRPPAEVNVLVLNAAVNQRGIAGRGRDLVEQAGFGALDADNAIQDQDTEIQYAEGFEADAIAVAAVFGLDESVVVPFPDSLNVEDPGDADVIVIIGRDNLIDI